MLDYHYKTFLTVCKTLNYTRTAEILNLSQPAVTNHIQSLEDALNIKLFIHQNRQILLTKEAELLFKKLTYMQNFSETTLNELHNMDNININIGCTLSISDYLMPNILKDIFLQKSKFRLNVAVENTAILLDYISQGKIEGAFIEGDFNHSIFSSVPFHSAKIVGICSTKSELANKNVTFSDLLSHHIITREIGSGTRSAFDRILSKESYDINSFSHLTTLGSIDLIKRVVEKNLGISFLFDICVQDELANGSLKILKFANSFESKTLHFVYLTKNPTSQFILDIIKN